MFVCQHCISNCNQNQQETGGCWTLTRFIFVIREVSRFYTDIQALIWEVCISLIETLATVNDHTDILLCNVFCHPVSKYVNTNREQRFSYQHHQLWHKHQLLWARQFFLWLWKILRPSYCFSAGIFIPNKNHPCVTTVYCYRNIHCQISNWINIPLSLFQFYCARLTLRSAPHQRELTLVKGPSPLKTLDIL